MHLFGSCIVKKRFKSRLSLGPLLTYVVVKEKQQIGDEHDLTYIWKSPTALTVTGDCGALTEGREQRAAEPNEASS